MPPTHQHRPGSPASRSLSSYEAPTEDTPEALNIDGYDDDDLNSEIRVAQAVPGASCPLAVKRFYSQYWVVQGTASSSEFLWGLLWAVGTTLIGFILTLWMGSAVNNGGDSVSSLLRVLYMLMVYVCPAWLLVHTGPTLSLIRRFRNRQRKR